MISLRHLSFKNIDPPSRRQLVGCQNHGEASSCWLLGRYQIFLKGFHFQYGLKNHEMIKNKTSHSTTCKMCQHVYLNSKKREPGCECDHDSNRNLKCNNKVIVYSSYGIFKNERMKIKYCENCSSLWGWCTIFLNKFGRYI